MKAFRYTVVMAICSIAIIQMSCGDNGGTCTPECGTRVCGLDPICGDSCGVCDTNESCAPDGTCQCEYEQCGSSCCDSGQVCNLDACCTPDCSGAACQEDGCGGHCGDCPNGDPCVDNEQCSSGFCVDGFCCDGPCDGPCENCSATMTGVDVGTCGNIQVGEDPEDECQDIWLCISSCNGSGECRVENGEGTSNDCADIDAPCSTHSQCSTGYCDSDSNVCMKIFKEVTTGVNHTCSLTSWGALYCWGANLDGELGTTEVQFESFVPVSPDISGIVGSTEFVHISAGYGHTCALNSEGSAYCWGYGASGELGNGTGQSSFTPVAVDTDPIQGEKSFRYLSGGFQHVCGITTEDVLYCWGGDMYGQLGNGSGWSSDSPSLVDTSSMIGDITFSQVSAGGIHTCGIATDGVLYCWGSDESGQLGNGSGESSSDVPIPVDTSGIPGEKTFLHVSCGVSFTCAITTDGQLFCWGIGEHGQLGIGSIPSSICGLNPCIETPTAVDASTVIGDSHFSLIDCGQWHACGTTVEGIVYCWGADLDGELGDGDTQIDVCDQHPCSLVPGPIDSSNVLSGNSFTDIRSGWDHSCGISMFGLAYCWGSNTMGQIGNGSQDYDIYVPVDVDISMLY